MNIFYAPPSHIHSGFAELTDQEAHHASTVMRVREGDQIVVVDGRGGRYEGPVQRITKETVQIAIDEQHQIPEPKPVLNLALGIIKKRDRLEFAVEKAVELGARRIALFRSQHTIKQNVRMDRLESTVRSAMKQSLRCWLPEITVFNTVDEVIRHFKGAQCLIAHEKVSETDTNSYSRNDTDEFLLLVGPEGGFSPDEVERAVEAGAKTVSLGGYRLRAETAAVAFMSQFL